MENALKIALIQTDLAWENPEQNRINLSQKIDSINESVDLVILPEMFTSGFTMNAEAVAEQMSGNTVEWMRQLSSKNQCAITGSLVIKDKNHYFNRMLFVHPNGQVDSYDKRHTFTLAGEHKVYEAGTSNTIVDYKNWKIKLQVCYDLRFPVWSRNVENYDLLLYVANWPKVRIDAWDTLLKARAIENMSYCVGVNRVGYDGNKHEYSGHSAVYDVLGNRLDHISENQDTIEIVTLNKSIIETYRTKLGFLKDRDTFSLE
ncbi:amidohydrolase [Psychroserpens sp. XS_ASV72]|uniref:amidohydrolase n=1 Tax=Psychroserpens sp. XS_ASV72 TaxID=3241293 RepID=UPI003514A277